LNFLRTFAISALILPALIAPAAADEGMWLFNQFPKDAVLEKYNFAVSPEFLDNLRMASARIPGGSASFVSSTGLLLTNQHLVSACLGKASTPGHDYRKDGFYAATQAAEIKCDGLDASVLMTMEDVTAKVKAAAKDNAPAAQAMELRNGAIAKLEKECIDKAGVDKAATRCSVIKLFSGGRYDLYQYKVYSDLRLVFTPEAELALFGHERDAVTYLRYGLDVAFLRAYEGGKPASTPHYLKWSQTGVKPNDLVFAVGNPDPTSRTVTAAELKYLTTSVLPLEVNRLHSAIEQLATFSAQNDANKQAAEPALSALLNAYKTAAGRLIGLRDDRMINRKTVFENKIKRAVETDPKLGSAATKVWDDIGMAYRMWTPFEKPYEILEGSPAPGSTLFAIARGLARDGTLDPSLASAAVNDKVEVILLTRYFEDIKALTDKDAPVKAVLNGKTPQQAAEAAVMGTTLKDPAERKKLAGNLAAIKASSDPLLKIALAIDDPARKLRKKREEMIGSLEATAEDKIAGYRFKLFGAAEPPDATGTPRVEFGIVKGYTDRAGSPAPFATSFGGLYFRTNNDGPYQVPQHWVDLKSTLNLETPLDFVSTADIGGGDYGSPVVNRAGELVGVTFDGNLESMPDTYLYSDEQARAVHVSTQGIAQALDQAYKTTALLMELGISH
jgi:Peptidase S46